MLDSKSLTILVVLGAAFLKKLIVDFILSAVVPTAAASSPISRGLARASHPQNPGFASCPNTIHPQVITQASHLASAGFNDAPATCALIFFPVLSSITLIISCLAAKLSRKTLISFVNCVCVDAAFPRLRPFVMSFIFFVASSNHFVISAYSGTTSTIFFFTLFANVVDSLSDFADSAVPMYRSWSRCFNMS